jgi:O-antigen/teichoic acid export membrane protein
MLATSIAVMSMFITYFIYFSLSDFFTALSSNQLEDAKSILLIVEVSFLVNIYNSVYIAVLRGYEKNIEINLFGLIKQLCRVVLLALAVYYYSNIIVLAFVELIVSFLYFIFIALYVRIVLHIRPSTQGLTKLSIRKILGYSFWMFILSIYAQLIWEIGKFYEARVTGAESVAFLSLSLTLSLMVSSLVYILVNMLFPKVIEMVDRKVEKSVINESIRNVSEKIYYFLLPIVIGFYYLGDEFIVFWLGVGYGEVYRLTCTTLVVLFFLLINSPYNLLIDALNKIKVKAIISISSLIFCITISLFFYPEVEYSIFYFSLISIIINLLAISIYLNCLGYKSWLIYKMGFLRLIYMMLITIYMFSVDSVVNSFFEV